MLFIADNTVLIECGDPLLWVLHYLLKEKQSGVHSYRPHLLTFKGEEDKITILHYGYLYEAPTKKCSVDSTSTVYKCPVKPC